MRRGLFAFAVLLGASQLPATSYARTAGVLHTVGKAAAYRTCRAGVFRSVVVLQGAAGQRVGQASLTNMGNVTCVLYGTPRVKIVQRNGQALPVHQTAGPTGPYGSPLGSIALVPGQRADVPIEWSNYCGRNPGRTHLLMRIPGDGTLAVRPGGMDGSMLPVPPCLGPGHPSTLGVGRFLPPTFDPANGVLDYYADVNLRYLRQAYGMLGGSKPTFSTFAAGYADTAHVTVNRVATPLYAIHRYGVSYTCVGVHFIALQRSGRRTGFGGWYLVASRQTVSFTLIPSRSSIHAYRSLALPTRAACARSIP